MNEETEEQTLGERENTLSSRRRSEREREREREREEAM